MSNHPLPVHTACYGVSQAAIGTARGYEGLSSSTSPSWGQRISQAKAQLAAQGSAKHAATGVKSQPAASNSPGQQGRSQAPSIKPQNLTMVPVSHEQYNSYVSAATAKTSTVGPASAARANTSSWHLDKSRLFVSEPPTQNLDFAAMADSSVGGSGLPRPYGRFNATRNGDGHGTYQRLPPPRVAAWHTRLYGPGPWDEPSAEEGQFDDTADAQQLQAQPSRRGPAQPKSSISPAPSGAAASQHSGSHSSSPAPPGVTDRAHSRHEGGPQFTRLSSGHSTPNQATPREGHGHAAGLESSVRRREAGAPGAAPPDQAPLFPDPAPPRHAQALPWYPLPSATFLTRLPSDVPAAAIRIDCGHTSAFQFLRSGLHTGGKPVGPLPAPLGTELPQAEVPAAASPGTAAAGSRRVSSSGVPGGPLRSPREAGASPAAAAAGAGPDGPQAHPSSPSYRMRHGVFVSADPDVDAQVRSSLGLGDPAAAGSGSPPAAAQAALLSAPGGLPDAGVPPGTAFLEAIHEAYRMPPVYGVQPDLATARRVTALPPERSLPRRHVPWQGR